MADDEVGSASVVINPDLSRFEDDKSTVCRKMTLTCSKRSERTNDHDL